MPVSSFDELIAALASETTWPIIAGTVESDWIDFKSGGYLTPDDSVHKLMLAEDVAAMANGTGGVLVVGFETLQDNTITKESAGSPSPVRIDLLNRKKHQDVISQYTYPPQYPAIEVWPTEDRKRAVMTIRVDAVRPDEKPVVVRGFVDDWGKARANYLSVPERHGDKNTFWPPERIHGYVRAGRRDPESGRAAYVGDDGSRPRPPVIDRDPTRIDDVERREAEAAELSDNVRLSTQIWPDRDFEISDIKGRGAHGFRTLFSQAPDQLRFSGFNLDWAGDTVDLPGGGLRRPYPRTATIAVEPDGLLTVIIGQEFLGWGTGGIRDNRFRINPWCVVESVAETMRFFVERVLPAGDRPVETVSGRICLSVPDSGPVPHLGGEGDPRPLLMLPSSKDDIEIRFSDGPYPQDLAGHALTLFYREFGLSQTDIPFLRGGEIDFEAIRKAER